MNFVCEKKTNVEIGQKLYGVVKSSIYTWEGVYELTVDEIDYNRKVVIFAIDQPCGQVACWFYEMNLYVFETEEEANETYKNVEWENGLRDYSVYY